MKKALIWYIAILLFNVNQHVTKNFGFFTAFFTVGFKIIQFYL